VPYTGGSAWKVFSFDLSSMTTKELFTIENGSYKALDASLSPDGKWIAYRDKENSSLYLVHPDGTQMHPILDKPSLGIGGIVWSQSGWLGVTLANGSVDEEVVVLVKPEDCQAYVLPALHGNLEGLFLP
jgi:hypothetical protein